MLPEGKWVILWLACILNAVEEFQLQAASRWQHTACRGFIGTMVTSAGGRPHLDEQVVAEVGHELCAGDAHDGAVAEGLEGLLQRLVE